MLSLLEVKEHSFNSSVLFHAIDPVTENCSCHYNGVPQRGTRGRDLRKLTQQGLIYYS